MGLLHPPPSQRTLQGPVPQRISVGQALGPLHTMSQLEASVQSTLLLQLESPQSTRQGKPAGQTTVPEQALAVEQS